MKSLPFTVFRGKDLPRPIVIKLKNTEEKAENMRKRKEAKKSRGEVKFSDDVTHLNTELITRFLRYDKLQVCGTLTTMYMVSAKIGEFASILLTI